MRSATFLSLGLCLLLGFSLTACSSGKSAQSGQSSSMGNFFATRTMGYVPKTANNIGADLDRQIMRHLEAGSFPRSSVSIACTVPVCLDDLKSTSPLARQMSEEVARYFMDQGYNVAEIRMGNEVVMTNERGEFILTRDVAKLQDRNIHTQLILVGTYTMTNQSVRFNYRLILIGSQNTVGMAAGTVPLSAELAPLLRDKENSTVPLAPSVQTKLPRR